MFFSFLRLKNFKRTKLAGISDIELTFTSPLQVILGTNGCGKTSVMRQTTPWPPETEHFGPGGEKEFHATRNGDRFVLKSFMKGKGWTHEFWLNDENLNNGGTGSVQKELVTRYFKINQDIHQLLTGDTQFHRLSIAKRRELFTCLSPTDLSYVLGVYNRNKSLARDVLGVRKHIESRITQETAKLLDDDTAKQYESEANLLHTEIQILLSNRKMGVQSAPQHNHLAILAERQSANLAQMCSDTIVHCGYSSQDELDNAIEETVSVTSAMRAKRDTMLSEFIDLNSTLMDIKNRAGGSKEDVLKRLEREQAQLATLSTLSTFELPEDCKQAHSETEEFETPLIEALSKIAGMHTEEFDFSKPARQQAEQELAQSIEAMAKMKRELGRAEHRLEHLSNAELTDCPKCQNRFVPGERKGERDGLEAYLLKLRGQLEVAEQVDQRYRDRVAHFEEFEQHLAKVRQIASAYPRCRNLFSAMVEQGFPYRTSQSTLRLVYEWKQQLYVGFQRRNHQVTITQLETALEQLSLNEGETGIVLEGRAKRLEAEIAQISDTIDGKMLELANLRKLNNSISQFMRQYEGLGQLDRAIQDELGRALDELRNQYIDDLLRDHQSRLAQLNARLKERDVAVALLTDLEQQLGEAKQKEIAYKLLIDALSPSDGLIAEQLSGFIATFVKSINVILHKVWSYPLKVLPCGIENDELNYRFPIEVGHEREPGADVSSGSEGQRDIFDFAFVLALGLFLEPETGWPLFLDELGSSFDEEHRAKVWQFVRDYVDAGKAPQAFMISHYAANHTALSSAQILVIDSNNVTVPRKHNEHVVLK